ncbi:MAG TPA: two-component regulator propeller domain-containing protein, partial [Acidobacteriota bacterium]|nr:two-component regulator propeller domain-containing protein [Acidobacteriota bacterium]
MRVFFLMTCFYLVGNILTAGRPVLAQDQPAEVVSVSSLNQHQWGAVALFHGLPSDQVRAIAQDQEGVLWFGTDNGLARFDGRRTQKITAAGVPSSRVSCLQPDPDGSLWIGSESGLYRFQGDRCELVVRSAGLTIRAIRLLKNGQVAVACEQGTLLQI